MREISLDRLRTLVVIADQGSFADAARALNLAPPTVSLHIADLEDRIGAPLLSRKRGHIRPSATGELLVERARRLLADAEQALDEVQRQVQGLGGRVRLGASTGAIAHLLPEALDVLRKHHPAIDVQIAILALALESAEAYAEYLHSQIRKSWGFADSPDMTMIERFQAKYRGKRYSFGYPACPRLDDQALLWDLLSPQEIGVQLTDGFMMDPEASVSAIAFHHPQATYFSVGLSGEAGDDNRS